MPKKILPFILLFFSLIQPKIFHTMGAGVISEPEERAPSRGSRPDLDISRVSSESLAARHPLNAASFGIPSNVSSSSSGIEIISSIVPNHQDKYGRALLHKILMVRPRLSTESDAITEQIRNLLQRNASATITDRMGKQPLHYAAANGFDSVIQLLILSRADVNCKDRNGLQPLHYAAANGWSHTVLLLLDNNAQCTQDYRGLFPIHHAAEQGKLNIVQLLYIRSPHSLKNYDLNGYTPLDYAFLGKQKEVVAYFESLSQEQHLPFTNKHGFTPWHQAAARNESEVFATFLNGSTEWSVEKVLTLRTEKSGESVIHIAAASGSLDILNYLLLRECNLFAVDKHGQTPLHTLCKKVPIRAYETAKYLVENGACLKQKDHAGKIPLDILNDRLKSYNHLSKKNRVRPEETILKALKQYLELATCKGHQHSVAVKSSRKCAIL